MILDIRANVYCNLGKVISGNFSDDFIQNSGLIRTSGTVVLDGTYVLTRGQKVEFAYYRNGMLSRLPRSLRVLSFFADPFRRTTTVEIGCAFTYYSNRRPPARNPTSSDENPETPCDDFQKRIVPISASYVFQFCLDALGLTATSNPLTSKFNIEEFDLSSGYVQVIGDLLVSEGYFCYLNEEEKVIVQDLNAPSNTGPLITANDIIDLSPIGVGDLPGDGAIVRYDSLRLKEPDPTQSEEDSETEIQIRNWELDTNSQTGTSVYVTAWRVIGVVEGFTQPDWILGWDQIDYEFPDYTLTETRTEYDQWNRVTKRTTVTTRPIAAVNPSYIAAQINNVVFNPDFTITGVEFGQLPNGTEPCEEIQVEYSYYARNPSPTDEPAPGSCSEETPPNDRDFDTLIRKETYSYDSLVKIIASVWQGNYYEPIAVQDARYIYGGFTEWRLVTDLDREANILVERTVETYDKQESSVTAIDAAGRAVPAIDVITKQTTEKYTYAAYTREGQRAIANQTSVSVFANNIRTVERALEKMGLLFESTSTSTAIGRNAFIEARPSRADRVNAATQKEEPETETVAEIAFIGNSVNSETFVEFSIPYPPDDYIEESNGQYVVVRSGVEAKALNFGRIQNRLLLGNRSGLSIQISADIMPPRPFEPIYIEANGFKGQYRVNGTSYTFDANGIIASTDALFWGGLE